MSSPVNPKVVKEFLDAFEEVFDRDWAHTKSMLGIRAETEEQKKAAAKLGLETIPIVAEDGTFVHPKVDDEVEDWGNRGRLLAAYRALKNATS
jgi:nitrogenase molybdenum-iron protein alpha/beta subunit